MVSLIEKVSLKQIDSVIPDQRKPYWVGLTEDCPIATVSFAGIDLCKRMIYRPFTNKSNPFEDDIPIRGKILQLTDAQIREFSRWLPGAIVRKEGANQQIAYYFNFLQVDPTSKKKDLMVKPWYNPRKGDELLVKYIWFIEQDPNKLPTLGKFKSVRQYGLAGTPEPTPNLIAQ